MGLYNSASCQACQQQRLASPCDHTLSHQLPSTFMQISALCRRSCTNDSAASSAMPSGSSFTEALRLASVLEMGTLGSKGRPRATCRPQHQSTPVAGTCARKTHSTLTCGSASTQRCEQVVSSLCLRNRHKSYKKQIYRGRSS